MKKDCRIFVMVWGNTSKE